MKAFMKKWQANKTKQFRLHSLLRIYSLVMIAIISSFALLLAYADWEQGPLARLSTIIVSRHALLKLW